MLRAQKNDSRGAGVVFGTMLAVVILVACKRGPQGEEAVAACRTGSNDAACPTACDYLAKEKRYADPAEARMPKNLQLLADVCAVACRSTRDEEQCRNARTGL